MRLKTALYICLIFLATNGLLGCASTHYVKTCPNFDQRITKVKNVGLISPICYGSNGKCDEVILENAITQAMQNNSPYKIKLLSEKNYPGRWDSNVQRAAQDSNNLVKQIELEGLWKDKKNKIISRQFSQDIKVFKTLDPDLDTILLVKCEQHYGNPGMAALYMFGAVGGIIAAASAEKDPVIGHYGPANNDTYATTMLVDLDTADILWYNFSWNINLDVTKEKDAEKMTKDILYTMIETEKP